MLDLLEREPAVAMAMLRHLAAMVRMTIERLSDMVALDVPGRLAKWLLAHVDADGVVRIDRSQEDLAHTLGTSRETLNRTLHRFERLGSISGTGHTLHIDDLGALRSVAEG